MGKLPAMLFYPSDWQRDLDEHPLEIEGAWIRICCRLWWASKRGELTLLPERWATILRTDLINANRIIDYLLNSQGGSSLHNIASGKREANGYITLISRRMIADDKAREYNRIRQQRFYRKQKSNADITPDLTATSQRSSYSYSSSSSKKKERKKEKIDPFILPDWIPKDLWEAYVNDVRKKKKAPCTKRAFDGCVETLEKLKSLGHDPGKVLAQSYDRGWVGLFELKEDSHGTGKQGFIPGRFGRSSGRSEPDLSDEAREQAERANRLAAAREAAKKKAAGSDKSNPVCDHR